jgi:hypothetical protein
MTDLPPWTPLENSGVECIYENSRYTVLRQDIPATDSCGPMIQLTISRVDDKPIGP